MAGRYLGIPQKRIKQDLLNAVYHSIKNGERFLSRHPYWASLYIAYFQKQTLNEFYMADRLPVKGKVAVIGCGPFPHTIITLAKRYGWSFVGLDHDPAAVKSAQSIIDQYQLSDRIEIRCCEGCEFDIDRFDLIIVSYGVEPVKEILEKLSGSIKENGMIVYRTIWYGASNVLKMVPIPESLRMVNRYHRIDGIKSLFLVRNEEMM